MQLGSAPQQAVSHIESNVCMHFCVEKVVNKMETHNASKKHAESVTKGSVAESVNHTNKVKEFQHLRCIEKNRMMF